MYLHVFVYVSCKKYNSLDTCGTKLEVNAYVVLVYQIPQLKETDGRISKLMTVNSGHGPAREKEGGPVASCNVHTPCPVGRPI